MPTNTDRIDPENNANPLAKGDINSTQNPTQDSSGEVGAEGSQGVIGVGDHPAPSKATVTNKGKDQDKNAA